MKKRVIATLIYINCLVLVLSGCAPRLVGEAKAKEAGLALIQQAYEVDLSDAVVTVEYREIEGVTFEYGQTIRYGTEEPLRFYNIRVNPDDENENADYFATVNALTGVAYRADKSSSLIPRTEQQQAQAAAVGQGDDLPVEDFEVDDAGAIKLGEGWVRERFESNTPILCNVANSTMTNNVDFPLFFVDFSVVFINGAIYDIEVCWPAMEVIGVYLRNQEY